MQPDVAHAYARFGFGSAPQDPVPVDARAWLAGQLEGTDAGPPGPSLSDAFAAAAADRQMAKANAGAARADAGEPKAGAAPLAERPHAVRDIFQSETLALQDCALSTLTPFRERLVWFWANHFTVSTKQGQVVPLVGDYVRNAIRPHVTGKFGDMLLAVMRHPAMLAYLDNAQSTGPGSKAGLRRGKGLNENLGRECLELHTVSPASGYDQADVTSFSKILTGWTFDQKDGTGFVFRPEMHEPGPKTLLGRKFGEGEEGGRTALSFLADHPATHMHLATKLVRHFVADTPPPEAVRRIAAILHDTGGDLKQASLGILGLPGAWAPLSKLRTPQDLVFATLRGSGLPPDKRPQVAGIVAGLGQGMFNAPFPIGWPDTADEWAGPEAMMRRLDWCYGFAGRPGLPEPADYADASMGPLLGAATVDAIRRAGSRRDALTLLLASPEFQRR